MIPLQLGQTRKTFLTGQRANIPFPVIRGDGIGGAWRGRGVWGLRMGGILFRRLAQLWPCPRLSPSPPILSSSIFILLEKLAESNWRVVAMWGSSFYPPLPLDLPALSITSEVSPRPRVLPHHLPGPVSPLPWSWFLTGPPSAVQSLVSCCGWRWFTGGPCVCFPFPCCWFC